MPLRPDASGKEMGRVCGRFQVQVLMGTKIYLYKKKITAQNVQEQETHPLTTVTKKKTAQKENSPPSIAYHKTYSTIKDLPPTSNCLPQTHPTPFPYAFWLQFSPSFSPNVLAITLFQRNSLSSVNSHLLRMESLLIPRLPFFLFL